MPPALQSFLCPFQASSLPPRSDLNPTGNFVCVTLFIFFIVFHGHLFPWITYYLVGLDFELYINGIILHIFCDLLLSLKMMFGWFIPSLHFSVIHCHCCILFHWVNRAHFNKSFPAGHGHFSPFLLLLLKPVLIWSTLYQSLGATMRYSRVPTQKWPGCGRLTLAFYSIWWCHIALYSDFISWHSPAVVGRSGCPIFLPQLIVRL